jgi:TonB family protein
MGRKNRNIAGLTPSLLLIEMRIKISLCIFMLAIGVNLCLGQTEDKTNKSAFVPTKLIVPRYMAAAIASHSQGEVIVEFTISPDGEVQESKIISGNKILGGNSLYFVQKWRFNKIETVDDKRSRKVRMTFVYKLIGRDRPLSEALTILNFPYRVEVNELLPCD